jgi:hypothetical protein
MPYDMLGTYTFEQINGTDINIDFEIPDNCFYAITEFNDEYTIAIKLNVNEKDPSPIFMAEQETVPFINGVLDVTFEQYEKTGPIRRPRVVINE